MTKEEKKKQAALAAIAYLKDGMHIGLGSGTTVNYFLQALQQRCAKGLQIRAMASSVRSNGRSNIRFLCWQIRMYKH